MRRKTQRGQELVEFALVISIVLIFLFGIIDWGIAFLNHETIAQRTAWAARYYSTTSDSGGATNIVLNGTPTGGGFTPSGMESARVAISENPVLELGAFTGSGEQRIHVCVAVELYRYQMFTPFVGQLITPEPIRACHPLEE